jgi:hypothetical protein
LSEPVAQETSLEPVQELKKRRSQAEKIGSNKWLIILVQRALDEIKKLRKDIEAEMREIRCKQKDLEVKQNLILKGFKGYGLLKYTPPMLQQIACKDAVDLAILDVVFRAGAPGVLPKDVALDSSLSNYGLKHYHVSRRIVRMNNRLFEELAECLFEKRGLKWALTSFAFEVWGETDSSASLSAT